MLVVTAIFLLVVSAVYLVYGTSQTTIWRGGARASVQQSIRSAVEQMRREIRNAGYDPSGTGQAGVQNPTSASMEFITDPTDSNVSALVKYYRDATTRTLHRTVKTWNGTAWGAATDMILARNVDALTFGYFDASGTATTSIPGMRRIKVTIQGSERVGNTPDQVQQVTTDVFLRNL